MIDIEEINASFLKISAEKGILQEISDYFTFDVPNAEFMKRRRPYWDGKIRLFNTRSKLLPSGLLIKLIEFLKENEYQHNVTLIPGYIVNANNTITFEKKLPFEVRDYQQISVKKAIIKKRSIVTIPTGGGKSLCAYLFACAVKKPILIIVPNISLVHQLHKNFIDYGYESPEKIQTICEGATRDVDFEKIEVVISTYQSIYNQPKEWFENFQSIIGDEVHLFEAKTIQGIMNKCINAYYRMGLTGTLKDTATHKLVLEGLFGEKINLKTTEELQNDGKLSNLEIKCLVLDYSDEDKDLISGSDYNTKIDFLLNHEKRNTLICNIAKKSSRNTLILFKKRDHGKILFDKMCEDENKSVFYIDGTIPASEREEIKENLETNEDVVVVASFGTFSTGIDIKNLHMAIFAHPTKSKITTIQSIGRLLRLHSNKNKSILIDIADDLDKNYNKNYSIKHFNERIEKYTNQMFNFKIKKIKI